MSERPKEITDENILTVDVSSIATDRRFQDLKFEQSKKKLRKVQKWFFEVKELEYKEFLSNEDVVLIKNLLRKLKEIFSKLLAFESNTTKVTAKQEHDNLEASVEHYFNQVYREIPMRILPYLREELAKGGVDSKDLVSEQKAAADAKRVYLSLKKEIETELNQIRARRSEVEQKQGEFVAVALGKDFHNQSEHYEAEAVRWLAFRNKWFWTLFGLVGLNLVVYLFLFVTDKLNKWRLMDPGDFFSIEYGVVKIAAVVLISYAIGFCSRNYNIKSGLATTNRHRKNVIGRAHV